MNAFHTYGLGGDYTRRQSRGRTADVVGTRLFDNGRDLSLRIARTEEGVSYRGFDLSWAYTGVAALNRVWTTGDVEPGRAAERVADVLACFDRWAAPVCWVADQRAGTTGWDLALRDAGFRGPTPVAGITMELSDLDGAAVPPSAGVTVRRVTSAADLTAWVRVNEEGQAGESLGSAAGLFAPYHLGGEARCGFYASFVAGERRPVARALTYARGKTVGVYWLAARADCRGRRYEAGLLHRALADARRAGADLAVSIVRTTDEPAWTEMGFTRRSTLKVYDWSATRPG